MIRQQNLNMQQNAAALTWNSYVQPMGQQVPIQPNQYAPQMQAPQVLQMQVVDNNAAAEGYHTPIPLS